MALPAPLTMAETAAAIGMGYHRFRATWRRLAADEGFPLPFRAYRWSAAAVEAWITERSRPPALRAHRQQPDDPRRARTARAQLAEIRSAP